jgi:hypothetical protein
MINTVPTLFGYSFSSSGGGGGTNATTLEVTLTAGEALAGGAIVYLDQSGGANAGKAFSALANSHNTGSGIAITKDGGGPGPVVCYRAGVVPVQMDVAPPATDNGKMVYLSAANSGKATLTPPLPNPGGTLCPIGRLQGANGITLTPAVLIDFQFTSYL